jgi:hypothetical protein
VSGAARHIPCEPDPDRTRDAELPGHRSWYRSSLPFFSPFGAVLLLLHWRNRFLDGARRRQRLDPGGGRLRALNAREGALYLCLWTCAVKLCGTLCREQLNWLWRSALQPRNWSRCRSQSQSNRSEAAIRRKRERRPSLATTPIRRMSATGARQIPRVSITEAALLNPFAA